MSVVDRVIVFSLLLAAAAPGQQRRVIPDGLAAKDGNTSTPYFSGYGSGRAQQVIDGAGLGRTGALLLGMKLRADAGSLAAIPARTFGQLKLTLGHTSKSPTTMTTSFAANRTGAQTTMFSGRYSLPAQPAGSRPFNIPWSFQSRPFVYTRKTGNLLIEFEVPGRPSKSQYFLDAHGQAHTSGAVKIYGQGGKLSANRTYNVGGDPMTLNLGGSATMQITVSGGAGTGAFGFWGASNTRFGAIQLPFSLAVVGAPGNFLNASPDLITSFVVQRGSGATSVPIPNNPWLGGKTIYGQIALRDAAANALGHVFTHGVAMTIGNGPGASVQMIGHYDSTQANGFMSRRPTGIVVELTGVFN